MNRRRRHGHARRPSLTALIGTAPSPMSPGIDDEAMIAKNLDGSRELIARRRASGHHELGDLRKCQTAVEMLGKVVEQHIGHFVDQSVLVSHASRPEAVESVLESLGLADADVRLTTSRSIDPSSRRAFALLRNR